MIQQRLISSLICGWMLVIAHASDASDRAAIRHRVEELINQLDAPTLVERSRAERQLLELGTDSLLYLPSLELVESVSRREAIRRLRPQLERRAAEASVRVSRVTLKGDFSLQDLITEIVRQTRNQVQLSPDTISATDPKISIDWSEKPFWDCLEIVCQRFALGWTFQSNQPVLELSANTIKEKPLASSSAGPIRVAVERSEIRSIFGDEKAQLLRLSGSIAVEPRLRILFLTMAASDLKSQTHDGAAIQTFNPGAKYEFPLGENGREIHLQWDFRIPIGMNFDQVSIGGKLKCLIAAATERIVFDQKSINVGVVRRRGAVSVRLRKVDLTDVSSQEQDAEVGIVVSYDQGGPAFESHRSWIFHNATYLETESKPRIPFTDFDMTQQTDGAVSLDYRWKNLAGQWKQYQLVYEAPTLLTELPFEFHLNDVRIKDSVEGTKQQNAR